MSCGMASNLASAHWIGPGYPFSTMIVNLLGSLLMGLLAGSLAIRGIGDAGLRLFLATGVLGGFTTFSAFSLDAISLYKRGELLQSALYVIGSVILSLTFIVVGMALSRRYS